MRPEEQTETPTAATYRETYKGLDFIVEALPTGAGHWWYAVSIAGGWQRRLYRDQCDVAARALHLGAAAARAGIDRVTQGF